MLELQKFILNNISDWEDKLKHDPYNLIVKNDDEHFVLFKYNQYNSDLSLPIVQECRGIILDKTDKFSIACYPFNKFFNFEEENAAKIDWKSARVQTKVDGSIMKVWWNKYKNKWMVSTNSCIDAFTVNCSSPKIDSWDNHFTFGDIFTNCAIKQHLDYNKLNKNLTYIFELTSVWNEQVIHYPDSQIWHIGTRNNLTCQELVIDIGIQKPEEWKFQSFSDVVKTAQAFQDEQEGFVVVDGNWNRVKVKSPYYVMTSHAINDNIGINNLVDVFLSGDYEEFLSYFPKYKDEFDLMVSVWKEEQQKVEFGLSTISNIINEKKDLTKSELKFALFNGLMGNSYQKQLTRYGKAIIDKEEFNFNVDDCIRNDLHIRDRLKAKIRYEE